MSESNGNGKPRGHYRASARQFSGGAFHQVYTAFYFLMSDRAAKALAALINAAHVYKALERKNGWFYYTIERMEFDVNMDADQQGRVFQELERLGFLRRRRMKVKGGAVLRHFYIKFDVLKQACDDFYAKREGQWEAIQRAKQRREQSRYSTPD